MPLKQRTSHVYLSLAFLLSLLILSGCYGGLYKTKIGDNENSVASQQADPYTEAKTALARGDYARAEVLGQRLMNDPVLSAERHADVARIYATSASRNRHPNVALTVLDQWKDAVSGADSTREWQDIWCEATNQLSSREARIKSNDIYQDVNRVPAVRGVAGIFFAVRQWEDGEIGQTMEALRAIYLATPDVATKSLFEGRLSLQLHSASAQATNLAMSTVTPENRKVFPFNLIAIDFLRKQLLQASDRSQAEAELAKLKPEVDLADPSLFDGPPLPKVTAYMPTTNQHIANAKTVALALPLSGSYGVISSKIAEGAEVACAEMAASGAPVNLLILDTESPDWISRLEASEAQMVGGPLRASDYSKAKQAGLVSKKTFFAFLPSLEDQDEGQTAWRFFTSPQDQIRALLNFSGKLGISSYASLFPNEPYGQRMDQLFNQLGQNSGMHVTASSGYTPNIPDGWRNIVGELLAENKNPSSGGFQAIFLPDGWKSSEILISTIFQFNEPRLLLLGTSLWEQGLAGQTTLQNPQNYQFAVFPGNWNAAYPSAAGQRLLAAMRQKNRSADFWTGLGYDYARLAVSLGVSQGWTPASVNTSLQALSFGWSIAPLRWDSTGRASQDLFLFTPVEGIGFAPVGADEFRKKYSELWQQNL